MSPGSGVKSEYMKRYQQPRWDECAPCYRELLRYRRGRRLLEQAHAPWLWDDRGPGSPSDDSASSASSGAASPSPPPPPRGDPAAREAATAAPAARGPAREQRAEPAPAAAHPALPGTDAQGKPEQQSRTQETVRSPTSVEPQQPSALLARGSRKAARSPQRASKTIKEKHPFALYGWGERQTDTGSQKTHNVCASAPVHEIHESALRAKNRRQVEKRKLVAQRQRAHSVDVEESRKLKSSAENPWVTEYMRCYSARA